MEPKATRQETAGILPRMLDGGVVVPQRTLDVFATPDVLIAGGGVAGCIAAIASARAGARTLLVESNSILGGTATAGLMGSIVYTDQASGITAEFVDRLAAAGGAPRWSASPDRSTSTPFDPVIFQRVAMQMVREAGAEILLSTSIIAPVMEGRTVRGIEVHNKSGLSAILAGALVDCTGDGDIAAAAGAPFYKGREEDSLMRPFSLLFRIGGLDLHRMQEWGKLHPDQIQPAHRNGTMLEVGGEHVITRISGFFDFMETAKAAGEMVPDLHYFRLENAWVERGTALCNTVRIYHVDGTDVRDLTRTVPLAWDQIRLLMDFMRKYVPGGENAFLLDVAPSMGIRETRRIIGRHFVSDDDVYSDRAVDDPFMTFEGAVPKPGLPNSADVHMPEAIEGSAEDLLERNPDAVPSEFHRFQLSYGCLLPQDVDGLLVAGRAISVSHRVDGMTRNQVVAMRTGQVAGTAAALSVLRGVLPHELSYQEALKPALLLGGMTDLEEGHLPANRFSANARMRTGHRRRVEGAV